MSTSLGVSAAGPEMVKTIRTLVRLPFPVCELSTEYDALAVGLVVLTNGVLLAMVAGAVTAKVGIEAAAMAPAGGATRAKPPRTPSTVMTVANILGLRGNRLIAPTLSTDRGGYAPIWIAQSSTMPQDVNWRSPPGTWVRSVEPLYPTRSSPVSNGCSSSIRKKSFHADPSWASVEVHPRQSQSPCVLGFGHTVSPREKAGAPRFRRPPRRPKVAGRALR